MCLDDYIRVCQDLSFKRSMFPWDGCDWDYLTAKIDDLLEEAQNNLTESEFNQLLEYV
jgi:hypothetical protein